METRSTVNWTPPRLLPLRLCVFFLPFAIQLWGFGRNVHPMTRKSKSTRTVYVVGAGFSAGLGYPLVGDLLIRLWERLPSDLRVRLEKVVKFHHPAFDARRRTSFPTIELLLSEMMANEQLFGASRSAPGNFLLEDLVLARRDLLLAIYKWFHEIHKEVFENIPGWLGGFREKMLRSNVTIISFNWDLILDQLLFSVDLNASSYGLAPQKQSGPILLKPHGSLNWYDQKTATKINRENRFELYGAGKQGGVFGFRHFREPISTKHLYAPLIVPPVYDKKFEHPIFQEQWRSAVAAVSLADRIIFLGYSLAEADLHARFILRCGFHNQIEGQILDESSRLIQGRDRSKPTGPSEVVIVNPDQGAAARIESAVGGHIRCDWLPMPVSKWNEVK